MKYRTFMKERPAAANHARASDFGPWTLDFGLWTSASSAFDLLLSAFQLLPIRHPLLDIRQYRGARLLRGHLRVVYDLGPERDHQRRRGALAVALVARREVLLNAVRRPAARALRQLRIQVILEIRFREHIRADVPSLHHEAAELDAVPLRLLHPIAHLGNRRHVRHRRAYFSRADFLGRIISVHRQVGVAVGAFEGGFPPAAEGSHRLGVLHIHPLLQAIPRQRAIHRARIHVHEVQRPGYQFGVGALAAGARPVNGNYDWCFGLGLRHANFSGLHGYKVTSVI